MPEPVHIRLDIEGHVIVIQVAPGQPFNFSLDGESLKSAPNGNDQLKPLHKRILAAAPAPDEPPVSLKTLARLANSSACGSFREAVNDLIDRGLLARNRHAYRRVNA